MLGSKLKDELFGAANPLGARIRIGTLQFRVIGVLASKGQFLGIDLDDTAFIPAARALDLFNKDGLTEINVSYEEGASATRVSDAVKAVLVARHGREDFTITTQEDMLKTLGNVLDVLTMAVGCAGQHFTAGRRRRHRHDHDDRGGGADQRGRTDARARRAAAHDPRVVSRRGGRPGGVRRGFRPAARDRIGAADPRSPCRRCRSIRRSCFAVLAIALASIIGLIAGVAPARRASLLDPVESLRAEEANAGRARVVRPRPTVTIVERVSRHCTSSSLRQSPSRPSDRLSCTSRRGRSAQCGGGLASDVGTRKANVTTGSDFESSGPFVNVQDHATERVHDVLRAGNETGRRLSMIWTGLPASSIALTSSGKRCIGDCSATSGGGRHLQASSDDPAPLSSRCSP